MGAVARPDDPLPVLVWESYAQFEMGASVLAEAGIPFVREGVTHGIVPDETPGNLPYLLVRRADFERARELLERTIARGVAPPR
jgi:hypothetical protein